MSLATRRAAAILAWVLVGSALHCRQIVGVEDREPPATCASTPSAPAQCVECVVASCCDEYIACHSDEPCAERSACSFGCAAGDAACERACSEAAFPTEAWAMFRSCEVSHCAEACGLECGGDGQRAFDGCSPCASDCCSSAAACSSNADCLRLDVCRAGCPEEGRVQCDEQCKNDHPEGASLEQSVFECLTARCELGDWACLDEVEWETGLDESIWLTVVLAYGIDYFPASGATVVGCYDVFGEGCSAPFGTTTSDGSGKATLEVPNLSMLGGSFRGYLDVQGPGLFPTLFFFYPPLFETTGTQLHAYGAREVEDLTGIPLMMPGRGHMLISVNDCTGLPGGGGVSVQLSNADEMTTILPFIDTKTGENFGLFFALNVPTGSVVVSAMIDPLCEPIGSVFAWVREGTLSDVPLPVTPHRFAD